MQVTYDSTFNHACPLGHLFDDLNNKCMSKSFSYDINLFIVKRPALGMTGDTGNIVDLSPELLPMMKERDYRFTITMMLYDNYIGEQTTLEGLFSILTDK